MSEEAKSVDHDEAPGSSREARSGGQRHRRQRRRSRNRGQSQNQSQSRKVYSALDLGTNNCRLLVARRSEDGFRVVDAFSRIVRLGEGVSRTNRLSEEAMGRAIQALSICAKKMRNRGVTNARCVATEACRKADNGEEFIQRVEAETGIQLDIIPTDEEARLAAIGCASLIRKDASHAIVFDIGGGSTELMLVKVDPEKLDHAWPRCADALSLQAWTSLREGVVTLAERHGGIDITPQSYGQMIAGVQEQLKAFEAEHDLCGQIDAGKVQMLGTSGTVTTLAGVFLNLPRYDRTRVDGLDMSFDDAIRAGRHLAGLTYEDRAAHPCIGRQRADLVVAGCAIFEAIAQTWPVGGLTVADRGLREGILQTLMRSGEGRRRRRRRSRK